MGFLKDDLFNEQVMSLDTYIMFKLKEETARLTQELVERNRAPISLSMGAPTAQPPKKLLDDLRKVLDDDGIHLYSTPKGEQYFRDAIAKRMQNRFGVDLDPNTEIFSLMGSKEGLANLIRAISTPKNDVHEKDIILVPDPGYASYWQFVKSSGAYGYHVPLTKENNYMPDMEQVLENLTDEGYNPHKVKALIINYPSNPSGALATKEYVQSVVEFCRKHKILLISDAAYCEMYFDEESKPFSVFEIEGAKDVAVEFYSFSKPYAITGWRLGWVCGNKDVVQRLGKLKSTIDNGIFKALQKVSADILNSKEGDDYIEEANRNYMKKQEIMVNGFKELGWDISMDKVPHATFYLWLPIPPKYKSAYAFCQRLLEKSGIVAVPGNAFGNYGEGYFRLSFVCSDEKLQEVIARMKADGFYFNK